MSFGIAIGKLILILVYIFHWVCLCVCVCFVWEYVFVLSFISSTAIVRQFPLSMSDISELRMVMNMTVLIKNFLFLETIYSHSGVQPIFQSQINTKISNKWKEIDLWLLLSYCFTVFLSIIIIQFISIEF